MKNTKTVTLPSGKDIEATPLLRALFKYESFFAAAGVFYGFPECCTIGFIEDYNSETHQKYPDGAFIGSGFVPCPCCAQEAHENWPQFQQQINERRHSSLPFPQDGNSSELHRFFYHLAVALELDPVEQAQDLRTNKELLEVIREEKKLSAGKHVVKNKIVANFGNSVHAEDLMAFLASDEDALKMWDKRLVKPFKKEVYNYGPENAMSSSLATIKDMLNAMTRNLEVQGDLNATVDALHHYLLMQSVKKDADTVKWANV